MSNCWTKFQSRVAKGDMVEEILMLHEKPEKQEQSKLLKIPVSVGGIIYDLKPMVPSLKQIVHINQQRNKELIVPNPSISVSQLLPL